MKLRITMSGITAEAAFYDTPTANAICAILPIIAKVNRWGDEVYFDIPLKLARAMDARDVLDPGELGYWPQGNAFCVFWGPTPSSTGNECRAYSPVNVFGKLVGDSAIFSSVRGGETVTVEAA